ncbi:MAG: hypothetical protein AB8G15_21745 [Saprospiraceae bacterium]
MHRFLLLTCFLLYALIPLPANGLDFTFANEPEDCTTTETTTIQVPNLTGGNHQIQVSVKGKCEKVQDVWQVTKYILKFEEVMNGGGNSGSITSQNKPTNPYSSGAGDQMMLYAPIPTSGLPSENVSWSSWMEGNDLRVSFTVSNGGSGSSVLLHCECGGCMDPNALNFDPNATTDDGSCEYAGCMDPAADNYDPNATTDDGSCSYSYYGCTDPYAENYDPNANIDDGSCYYAYYGCTDPSADNYDPNATIDDGSCYYAYYGCTDPSADNYDPSATMDDGRGR